MPTSFRQVVSSRKMAFQPPTYERRDRSMSSTVVREFQPPMDSMHLRRLRSQERGRSGAHLWARARLALRQRLAQLVRAACFCSGCQAVDGRWFAWMRGAEAMCMGCEYRVGLAPDAGGAVEIEEAAGAKVHPLLALAVVVQAELLRLRMCGPPRCQRTSNGVKTRRLCGD